MNYMIASDMVKVGIESKVSSPETSTNRFRATLTGVLNDVRDMIEASRGGASKL